VNLLDLLSYISQVEDMTANQPDCTNPFAGERWLAAAGFGESRAFVVISITDLATLRYV
jgi:hypothetical protein